MCAHPPRIPPLSPAPREASARVASRGQVALVGLYGRNVEVALDAAIIKEQTLLPSFTYGHGTWERTMELLAAAAIDPAPLVSGRYLLETWEEAFALARSRRGHKYLLLPTS